jgi:hypothetical protein
MNQTTSKLEMIGSKGWVILLLSLLWPTLSFCQYEGGSGRQEALSSTSVLQLNDGQAAATSQLVVVQQPPSMLELSQQFILKLEYRTANGQLAYFETGNVSLTFQTNPSGATLGGTSTLAATAGVVQFSGLSVDKIGTGYELLASGASSTSAVSNAFSYFSVGIGGSGRQDAMADVSSGLGTLSGQVFWVGGLGATPTAWNDPLNWFPNTAVPDQNARIAIEPNNNGHNPILDQNRTIYSMNFNGANKKLELGSNTLTVAGGMFNPGTSSYVQTASTGSLKRSIINTETFTFPVGNSTYNPVSITNNTGSSDDFSVRVRDAVYLNATSGTIVPTPHVQVTWDITKASGSSSAGNGVDFEFQWDTIQESIPMANYYLNHHNGTGWEIPATTGTPLVSGSNPKTLAFPSYKGTFSPFAIGNSSSALPVQLISFWAECGEDNLRIFQWQTATEYNNDFFVIEELTGDSEWNAVCTVPGAGISTDIQNYRHVYRPTGLNAGIATYYRLKKIDYDGIYDYSGIISLSCAADWTCYFANPIEDNTVTGFINTPVETIARVELISPTGQLIAKRDPSLKVGSNLIEIDHLSLSPGVYVVRVNLADEVFIHKLMVTH